VGLGLTVSLRLIKLTINQPEKKAQREELNPLALWSARLAQPGEAKITSSYNKTHSLAHGGQEHELLYRRLTTEGG